MRHDRIRADLDAYYASRPDRRPALKWPVHDDYWCASKPVAWFDDYGSAVEAVNAEIGTRNLYIGEPRRKA